MVSRRFAVMQLACLLLAGFGIAPLSASGSALWANIGAPLHPINVDTGGVGPAVNFVGSSLSLSDLAGDAGSQGVLVWGVSGFVIDNRLVALNPATMQVVSSVVISSPERIASLAIDPITGGFYGASTTSLYQISPATGVATLIAPTAYHIDKALGFDLLGNLFGILLFPLYCWLVGDCPHPIRPIGALVIDNPFTARFRPAKCQQKSDFFNRPHRFWPAPRSQQPTFDGTSWASRKLISTVGGTVGDQSARETRLHF